jgi:uncharacterized membrane protein YfhO
MCGNLVRLALFLLAAVTCLALPLLRSPGRWAAAGAGLACFALIALDIGQANHRFNTHADPAWLDRASPAVRFLQSDKDVFRIARLNTDSLHPNLPTIYSLQDTGGYDSILLSDYVHYLNAIEPQKRLWYNQITSFDDAASLDAPLFSLLNVRYLLTFEWLDHPDWERVYDDEIRIYRNRQERPRAFMVHRAEAVGKPGEALERIQSRAVDPGVTALVEDAATPDLRDAPAEPAGEVRITRYAHAAVELATSSDRAGIVVLCDMMYPGWQVEVDGAPAELLKVDGIFRGVRVPAGEHAVVFRFEPAVLRQGWQLAGGGAVVLALMMIIAMLTRSTASRSTRRAG